MRDTPPDVTNYISREVTELATSAEPQELPDDFWVNLAREAYSVSTSYVDANYRRKWENSLRHMMNKHQLGSKYLTAPYQYRSKFFRPKTRSAYRTTEAMAVAAFFSNPDIVAMEPENGDDPVQVASARVQQQLLQYRLDNRSGNGIPWFLVVLGALYDAWTYGVVVSKQYWIYEEKEEVEYQPVLLNGEPVYDEDGNPLISQIVKRVPVKDKPWVEIRPVENFRIHPASDWLDPINSSPFLVDMIPMFYVDLKNKLKEVDENGEPKWLPVTDDQIASATRHSYDSTRLTREDNRQEKYDVSVTPSLKSFDIVWVHENIFRIGGRDIVFKTLGTETLLTKPKPLEEVYHHGVRPYVMGYCLVEPHKIYPTSVCELGEQLQKEINENANQRADNVKLCLNKRFFVRAGAQVDIKSLLRNVPGGVTFVGRMHGPDGPDVFPMEFHDVTSSAYAEQDRLNADFDEVIGLFSASTLNTNRRLNETVGGLSMLRGSVNMIKETELRVFAETWMEPVLRQLIKLEQVYENDPYVLAVVAGRAGLIQRYGIDKVTDELLKRDITIRVNVGMGATDPMMKINNFHIGMRILNECLAIGQGVYNFPEVAKEVFSRLGYKDCFRFLQNGMQTDPEKIQLAQQLQQATQELYDRDVERETRIFLAKLKEMGQIQRKKMDVDAKLTQKYLELMNPVSGEKPPAGISLLGRMRPEVPYGQYGT